MRFPADSLRACRLLIARRSWSSIHRMLRRLERHGAATEQSVELPGRESAEAEPAESEEAVSGVLYTIKDNVPYPSAAIANETTLLPLESRLMDVVDRLEVVRDNCGDLVELDDDQSTTIRAAVAVHEAVAKTGPRTTVQRAVVTRTIAASADQVRQLLDEAVHTVADRWAAAVGAQVANDLSAAHPSSGQTFAATLQAQFGPVVEALSARSIDFALISEASSEKAMLVLAMPEEADAQAIAVAYARCLNRSDKEHEQRKVALPVIHVALDTTGMPPMPQEIVEVGQEFGLKVFGWVFGPQAKAKKEARDVEGWWQFLLAHDASNLDQFGVKLTEATYLDSAAS